MQAPSCWTQALETVRAAAGATSDETIGNAIIEARRISGKILAKDSKKGETFELAGNALRQNPDEQNEAQELRAQSAQIWHELKDKGVLNYADLQQLELAAHNFKNPRVRFVASK